MKLASSNLHLQSISEKLKQISRKQKKDQHSALNRTKPNLLEKTSEIITQSDANCYSFETPKDASNIVYLVFTKASAARHLNKNHECATKKLKSDMDDVQNQFSKVNLDEMKCEENASASLFGANTSVILVKKEQHCYKQNLLQLSNMDEIQKIAKNDPQVLRSLYGALHFNQQLTNKRNSTLENKRKLFMSNLECTNTGSKNLRSINAYPQHYWSSHTMLSVNSLNQLDDREDQHKQEVYAYGEEDNEIFVNHFSSNTFTDNAQYVDVDEDFIFSSSDENEQVVVLNGSYTAAEKYSAKNPEDESNDVLVFEYNPNANQFFSRTWDSLNHLSGDIIVQAIGFRNSDMDMDHNMCTLEISK